MFIYPLSYSISVSEMDVELVINLENFEIMITFIEKYLKKSLTIERA